MHAIVSLLDEQHHKQMEDLWRELEFECGLTGINLTPLPHFSWHLAAEYDFKRLETVLVELALGSKPFFVRASGLGLFTGQSPVIYIPLVKDHTLANFHQCVWQRIKPTAIGASPHYAPESWVPHITLAYGDVERSKLGCAMQKLAFQSFDWQIKVDQLALVYQYSGQVGNIQSSFPFRG